MKTILITGANRGIGLEFVKQFSKKGHRIIACCRAPEKAAALQAIAQKQTVEIHGLDVNRDESIANLVTQLGSTKIDLLINNAGIYGLRRGLGELDYEVWQNVFLTNTLGPIRVTEALVNKDCLEKGALLVYITSKMGSIADNSSGGAIVYRSSKAALNAAVKSVSHDLSGVGIHAMLLHPGWVQTDMGGPNALITTEESVSNMCRVIESFTPAMNGKFLNYDGKDISW